MSEMWWRRKKLFMPILCRYSYHHKLLPLLLTGAGDEVEEVKRNTLTLWDKVRQWAKLDFVHVTHSCLGWSKI